MNIPHNKMHFQVKAKRIDSHGSEAYCKESVIALDTDLHGQVDAFNPAELLLAALAACIIKGIERVTLVLKFELRSVAVKITGIRQDVPPCMESITYEIKVDSDEKDRRLELLHENIKKYGTIFNTLSPGTTLSGTLIRVS